MGRIRLPSLLGVSLCSVLPSLLRGFFHVALSSRPRSLLSLLGVLLHMLILLEAQQALLWRFFSGFVFGLSFFFTSGSDIVSASVCLLWIRPSVIHLSFMPVFLFNLLEPSIGVFFFFF